MTRAACLLTLLSLSAAATAEPVVQRFPLYMSQDPETLPVRVVDLVAFDARFPGLTLRANDTGGGGVAEISPSVSLLDDSGPIFCDPLGSVEAFLTSNNDPDWFLVEQFTEPGTTTPSPNAEGIWGPADLCPDLRRMPLLRMDWNEDYSNYYGCGYGPHQTVPIELTRVYFYPIRVNHPGTLPVYGWIAVQAVDVESVGCSDECVGISVTHCRKPILRFVAAGFETQPDTPIVVGGGFCRADLNFDAVLDLSDVQAFISAFTMQQTPADLTEDGVFDLADVQAFINSFFTGCDI